MVQLAACFSPFSRAPSHCIGHTLTTSREVMGESRDITLVWNRCRSNKFRSTESASLSDVQATMHDRQKRNIMTLIDVLFSETYLHCNLVCGRVILRFVVTPSFLTRGYFIELCAPARCVITVTLKNPLSIVCSIVPTTPRPERSVRLAPFIPPIRVLYRVTTSSRTVLTGNAGSCQIPSSVP